MKLKELIKRIGGWFKLFLNKNLPVAVHAVQGVKKAIESGTFDDIANILKMVIPGGADDIIIDRISKFAKKHIPVICIQLEILSATNSNEINLKEALTKLKDVDGDKWAEFTSGLAGDILAMLEDNKIDAGEAKQLAKAYYDRYVRKA